MFKNLKTVMFSPLLLKANVTRRIAYLGVMTALSVVFNTFLEIKFADTQFSFTIFMSICMGVLLGAAGGFSVCFLGDLVGYLFNSMGFLYMFWVGLSTATCAFIAGVIYYGVKFRFKGAVFVKLAIISLLTFLVCTIGINSTGFYYYNLKMGFSTAVINYVSEKFGTGVGYFGYIAYRLIFKGQIFNSLLNYGIAFIVIPMLIKIKYFNLQDTDSEKTDEENEN